jgi:hypothetical protein
VAQLVPEMFARTNRVFPIERTENHLTIAMADPLDIFAMDDVRIMTGLEVEPVIASDVEIQAAISEYFGAGPGTKLAITWRVPVPPRLGPLRPSRSRPVCVWVSWRKELKTRYFH